MKTKFLSVILSLVAVGCMVLLIKQAIDKPEQAPEPEQAQTEEIDTQTIETEVSPAFVVQTAHDAENLMDKLAYSAVENPEESLTDLTDRLNRSAEYLKDTMADYYGATYFSKLAQILDDIKNNPFTDNATFGTRVGMILTELANTYPATEAPKDLYYPVFDTEANGKTALAMLALRQRQIKNSTNGVLLTFGGNVFMGDNVLRAENADSFKSRQSSSNKDYPLYSLSAVLNNDTVTFVNLENPLTNSSDASAISGSVKGSPAYAELLKKNGVEIVSTANNGVMSYGETGYKDTLNALKDGGVEYTENGKILYYETNAGTIAFISYNIINQTAQNVNLTDAPNTDIPEARENGAKLVIVHFNWVNTEENQWDPSMSQVITARNAADQGADLVIASHPDAIESIERYKGISIVYSPNDLCKNGSAPQTGLLFQQAFTIDEGGVSRGEIHVFPVVSSNEYDGAPYLLLDAGSADAFLNIVRNASNPVKYGVGKRDEFKLEELNVISIAK